jgi:Ran GTPase-activating protein (RanGAP) involved in mRNA processing and transport
MQAKRPSEEKNPDGKKPKTNPQGTEALLPSDDKSENRDGTITEETFSTQEQETILENLKKLLDLKKEQEFVCKNKLALMYLPPNSVILIGRLPITDSTNLNASIRIDNDIKLLRSQIPIARLRSYVKSPAPEKAASPFTQRFLTYDQALTNQEKVLQYYSAEIQRLLQYPPYPIPRLILPHSQSMASALPSPLPHPTQNPLPINVKDAVALKLFDDKVETVIQPSKLFPIRLNAKIPKIDLKSDSVDLSQSPIKINALTLPTLVEQLKHVSRLKYLNLSKHSLGSHIHRNSENKDEAIEGIKAFAKFLKENALMGVDLSSCKLHADDSFIILKSLVGKDLVALDLSHNELRTKSRGNEVCLSQVISSNPNLTYLNVGNNVIGDGLASLTLALSQHRALTCLNLGSTGLRVRNVSALQQMPPNLTSLNLSVNDLGIGGTECLGSGLLAMNTTITALDLSSNNIKDAGAAGLCVRIQTNSTLASLKLRQNHIQLITTLAALLEISLIYLDLSMNVFLPYSLHHDIDNAAVALSANSCLQTLILSGNQLTSDAISIANALQHNRALTFLDLSQNQMPDHVATAFALMLPLNPVLRTLNFSDNNFGDEGARDLAECLGANTTLTNLSLEKNPIGQEGAQSLGLALVTNTTLRRLSFYNSLERSTEAYHEAIPGEHSLASVGFIKGETDHIKNNEPAEQCRLLNHLFYRRSETNLRGLCQEVIMHDPVLRFR